MGSTLINYFWKKRKKLLKNILIQFRTAFLNWETGGSAAEEFDVQISIITSIKECTMVKVLSGYLFNMQGMVWQQPGLKKKKDWDLGWGRTTCSEYEFGIKMYLCALRNYHMDWTKSRQNLCVFFSFLCSCLRWRKMY